PELHATGQSLYSATLLIAHAFRKHLHSPRPIYQLLHSSRPFGRTFNISD
ncbi:laminin subunit alpha-5 isoform X1, partial [Clarias magur]